MNYLHDWPAILIGAGAVIALEILGFGLVQALWRMKVEFYLYFANEAQALPAVVALKRKGFKVESKSSADEKQWLVLAVKSVGATSLGSVESKLESLAKAYGGEYDGFDRAL